MDTELIFTKICVSWAPEMWDWPSSFSPEFFRIRRSSRVFAHPPEHFCAGLPVSLVFQEPAHLGHHPDRLPHRRGVFGSSGFLLWEPFSFQSITLSLDVDRGVMVQHPVQDGAGDDRISLNIPPISIDLIRCQDHQASHAAPGDGREEQVVSQAINGDVALIGISR